MKEPVDAIERLTEIVKAEESALARFAWRCLAVRGNRPSREDIEDAMSEAYIAAVTRLQSEPTLVVRNLGAWFRKFLFFKCLTLAKRRRLEGQDDLSVLARGLEEEDTVLDAIASRDSDPDQALIAQELLSGLDPAARRILELSAEGYTSAEIAEVVRESADNVRQIKVRTLNTLRARHLGRTAALRR
jgi:RNA polymerase sigma factor (sigma-70 family)